MGMTPSHVTTADHPTGRRWLLFGLGLAALGILSYAAQVLYFKHLKAPWYLPLTATLAVILLIVALSQKRTAWRFVALLVLGLLAAAEWAFLLAFRLPPYTGPVAVGRPFPEFTTARADGTPFTHRDLVGDRGTVLVFFRGRW
jgi:hypothetical protein